jgi:hypothetical protein
LMPDGNVPGSVIINPKNSAPKKPSRLTYPHISPADGRIDRSRSTPAATRTPTKRNEPPSPAISVDSDNNPSPASLSSPIKLYVQGCFSLVFSLCTIHPHFFFPLTPLLLDSSCQFQLCPNVAPSWRGCHLQ